MTTRGMCEVLEIGLRKRGFDVIWRTQPLAALQLLPEENISAMVVDLNMPGTKGYRAVQPHRRQPPRRAGHCHHSIRQP
jgi:DNA-binding response OmpR family regulator